MPIERCRSGALRRLRDKTPDRAAAPARIAESRAGTSHRSSDKRRLSGSSSAASLSPRAPRGAVALEQHDAHIRSGPSGSRARKASTLSSRNSASSKHVQLHADPCQQAHPFDMIAMLQRNWRTTRSASWISPSANMLAAVTISTAARRGFRLDVRGAASANSARHPVRAAASAFQLADSDNSVRPPAQKAAMAARPRAPHIAVAPFLIQPSIVGWRRSNGRAWRAHPGCARGSAD